MGRQIKVREPCTVGNFEDVQIIIARSLTVRCECVLAVAKKVGAYLGVSKRFHVFFGSIYATARLLESDDMYGIVGGTVRVFA